jgi:putative ABC transport system substrate-binding protein
LLTALAGAMLAAAQPGRAQAPGKPYHIGMLANSRAVAAPLLEVFAVGMRELGWVDGRDYVIDDLYAEGHLERLPALADELVRRKVDLFVCAGTLPTRAAKRATSTIPIVFYFVADPEGSGFVASLARPGGNLTGQGGLVPEVLERSLWLLKQTVPRATQVAVMWFPEFPRVGLLMATAETAARSLGITLRPVALHAPDDIDTAFATLARDPADALLIFPHPFLFSQGARAAKLALALRLPTMVPFRETVRDGMLMSYGFEIVDDMRRVPYFVDRILKGGMKPADLPVERPTRFHLVVNLKTAKAIGVTIPQSVLLSAGEVIE